MTLEENVKKKDVIISISLIPFRVYDDHENKYRATLKGLHIFEALYIPF